MVEKMNTGDHKNGIIIEIGEADFESVILKSKEANIVVFSASWSHPCQILEAILEDVVASSSTGFKIFKIDADKNLTLS